MVGGLFGRVPSQIDWRNIKQFVDGRLGFQGGLNNLDCEFALRATRPAGCCLANGTTDHTQGDRGVQPKNTIGSISELRRS